MSDGDDISADPSEDNSADADSQTTGLIINVSIGIPLALFCLFIFDPLRRRIPSVFETRRQLHEDRDPLDYNGNRVATPPAPSYKFLGWLQPTLRLDLSTIADTHGLDTSLFLRYHLNMLFLFCLLAVPSVLLLPTYFTGTNKDLPDNHGSRTKGINRFSISNIQADNNWRFWLILVVEYAIVAFVCYYLFHHFTLYARDRRRYRASRHPANYAVLVQDIPPDYRTADAVRDYWERVFPGLVATVFYVADARALESWKSRFWEAVDKRETAEWKKDRAEQRAARRAERAGRKKFGDRTGLRRRRRKPGKDDKDVKQLDEDANHSNTTPSSKGSVVPTPSGDAQEAVSTDYIPPTPSAEQQNMAKSFADIADAIPPTPSAEQQQMATSNADIADVIPPTPSADQEAAARASADMVAKGSAAPVDPAGEEEAMKYPSMQASLAAGAPDASKRLEKAVSIDMSPPSPSSPATPRSSRVVDHDADDEDADKHFRRARLCGIPLRTGPPRRPNAAVEYWEVVQRKAWARVVAHQRMRDEGQFAVTSSAIVVFKSRRAASVAAQTNFARKENEWRVSRAPEPNAIDWSALCVDGWTVYIRQLITTVLGVALTLFWIAPVTAIMTMVNLKAMADIKIGGSQPFKFLEGIQDLSPLVTGFIESWLPTVVLTFFLMFVPNLFEFFVSISRITSQAEQDRQVRDWYFIFVLFSNFLFVAFAGTLLQELSRILKEPAETVQILARNIPKQAAFMMNFIVLTALWEAPQELLQLTRVVTRWFKLRFTSKTKRQRDESDVGDMEMDFVGVYSTSQLVTLLGMVYCTIQPFIVFCCIGYFAVSYVVFKYNVCFSLYNEYEDGGRMYGGALYGLWMGLFAHLMVMVGVFGLNKSPAQSALIIIPTVASVLFLLHIRKSFMRVLDHGSALETQDRIEEMEGLVEDDIDPDLADTYEHPGFEDLPEYHEIENLNGLSDGEDSEPDLVDIEKRAADKAWELERLASEKAEEDKQEKKEVANTTTMITGTTDGTSAEVSLTRRTDFGDREGKELGEIDDVEVRAEMQRVASVLQSFGSQGPGQSSHSSHSSHSRRASRASRASHSSRGSRPSHASRGEDEGNSSDDFRSVRSMHTADTATSP